MKKVEIKKLGPLSLFKAMMYMMSIPIILLFIIGIITAIVGAVSQAVEVVIIGVVMAIVYPIMFVVFYGLFGTLMALVYNFFASKFGGLELTLNELDKTENVPANVEDAQ